MLEVFRDLYVHGDREQVAAVIAAVEHSLTGGWTRDSLARGTAGPWFARTQDASI